MMTENDTTRDKKVQVKIVELIEVNGKHVTKEGGKRQYHHKSKNGCDNCKRRRVKCTEEKPECYKCSHLGLECVYTAPQPRRRRTRKEIEMMKLGIKSEEQRDEDVSHDEPLSCSAGTENVTSGPKEDQNKGHVAGLFVGGAEYLNEARGSTGLNEARGPNGFSDARDSSKLKKRKLSAAASCDPSAGSAKKRDSKSTIVKYVVTKEDGSKVEVDDGALVSKVKSPRSRSNTSATSTESGRNPTSGSKQLFSHVTAGGVTQQSFPSHMTALNPIPQLMSLTSSEKYANTLSASADLTSHGGAKSAQIDTQFGAIFQNLSNAMNSPQANSMSMTNSIGTFFSLSNAKLLSSLTRHSKHDGSHPQSRELNAVGGDELGEHVTTTTSGHNNNSNNNNTLKSADNPHTPDAFRKDTADLSKHLSLSGLKQHVSTAKSPLASLPRLASAFNSGQNAWAPFISSLAGAGSNSDDVTATAMSFLTSLGNLAANPSSRKNSITGLQGNHNSAADRLKLGSMVKPGVDSSHTATPSAAASATVSAAELGASKKPNPSSVAQTGSATPTTLASLATLGIGIGGPNIASMIPAPVNYHNNNNSNSNNNHNNNNNNNNNHNNNNNNNNNHNNNNNNTLDLSNNPFGSFNANHKMSVPTTPSIFQPAGIGGITYDFNDLITGPGNHSSSDLKLQTTTTDKLKPSSSLLGTPEILKSPLIAENGNKNAFSRVQQDLKDEAVEVLSTMATVAQRDKKTANDNKNSPGNMLKQQHIDMQQSDSPDIPFLLQIQGNQLIPGLNLIDLKLFHHFLTTVSSTIVESGICASSLIWSKDIPDLAFQFPFLMHAVLAFSATHLSRTQQGLEEVVATHRLDCLKLLKDAVLEINAENTDALVASAIILIMDSLANAVPAQRNHDHSQSGAKSGGGIGDFTTSAWIFHVKGAATILTAVWPLHETSRFYNLINVDLSELGQYLMANSAAEAAVNKVLKDNTSRDTSNSSNGLAGLADENVLHTPNVTDLVCFDDSISDLYPVEIDSPYLITLAYLDKLNKGINNEGFILRIFSFPALLDKTFLLLLMTGDMNAMRIMRCYYKMLRSFVTEKKDKIWFLEGLPQVLPADVDEYSGGGVYMMLDFLGNGLPSMMSNVFESNNMNSGFDFSVFASGANDNGNMNSSLK